MAAKGHSGKTQHNRLLTVTFLLKTNGLKKTPCHGKNFQRLKEDPAVPFEPDELKKLFAAMTDEEKLRYNFFSEDRCAGEGSQLRIMVRP